MQVAEAIINKLHQQKYQPERTKARNSTRNITHRKTSKRLKAIKNNNKYAKKIKKSYTTRTETNRKKTGKTCKKKEKEKKLSRSGQAALHRVAYC